MESESKRPLGITIIVIWLALEGIFYFYTNSIGMFGGQDISSIFRGTMAENAITAYSLGMAFFNFVLIWAFLERKSWARLTTIVVFSITIAITWVLVPLGYFSIFNSAIVTGVLIIIIIYLLKPTAKQYFVQSSEIK